VTVAQTGQFAVGTYGFPVYVQLPDDLTLPANAQFLANVATINLNILRPDGTTAFNGLLTLPGAISDIRGVVVFTVGNGWLTVRGAYKMVLTVHFSTPVADLVVDGNFQVIP
jgi:hypothetical protein